VWQVQANATVHLAGLGEPGVAMAAGKLHSLEGLMELAGVHSKRLDVLKGMGCRGGGGE
jgi:hypothetical protein